MFFRNRRRIRTFSLFWALLIFGMAGQMAMSQNPAEETKHKVVFVAYNSLYKLGTPTYPVQSFVVNISPDGEEPKLVKLLYFPKPSSTYDGVRFLDIQPLLDSKVVVISWRRPDPEKSKQCEHIENFVDDGTENGEPQLLFRSLQYDAFMTFEFDKMECYELVAVQRKSGK